MGMPQGYRSVAELPTGAVLAIWGSGGQGRDVLELLRAHRPDISVACFLDSFTPGQAAGLPVLVPGQGDLPQFDLILVASHYKDQILESMDPALRAKAAPVARSFVRDLRFARGEVAFRSTILVELTQSCIMACDFCTHRIRPASTLMRYELYESIIEQISQERLAGAVELSGLGEPLLYKRIYDAVELAGSKGLHPCFLTNGILLTPEVMERLNRLGLYRLFVSLQTLSKRSYAHRGVKTGMTYDEYIDQICAVIEAHVAGRYKTKLFFKVLYAKPEWEISQIWDLPGIVADTVEAEAVFARFRERLEGIAQRQGVALNLPMEAFLDGVDTLDESGYNSVELVDVFPNIEIHLTNLHPVFHTDMLRLNAERADQFDYVLPQGPTAMDCYLTELPYITATGDVFPCPSNLFDPDDFAEMVLGNVNETPLKDILLGDKYRSISRQAEEGCLDLDVCAKCKTRYKKISRA